MAEKNSMIFYYEWIDLLDMIPDKAQAYEVIHSIIDYLRTGEVKEFSETGAKMAYCMMKNQTTRDAEKYEEIRTQRIEAGRKGGKTTQEKNKASASAAKANRANASFVKANQAVNVFGNGNATANGDANADADVNSNANGNSNGMNTEYITADAADVPHPDAKGIDALTAEQPLIGYFYEQYKVHTGKNHPSVSMPKLIEIATALNSNEADESFVDEYFGSEDHKGLSGDSDCSIFHFASPTVQELLTDRLK